MHIQNCRATRKFAYFCGPIKQREILCKKIRLLTKTLKNRGKQLHRQALLQRHQMYLFPSRLKKELPRTTISTGALTSAMLPATARTKKKSTTRCMKIHSYRSTTTS